MAAMKLCLMLLAFFTLYSCVSQWKTVATLSKSDKKKTRDSSASVKDVVLTVADRGLISEKITWKNIADNHKLYSQAHTSEPQFSGNVLGYVTPWNSHGYDVAKIFPAKFAYVSPVWLQLVPSQGGVVSIQGGHDIDKGWVRDVKRGSANVKILPRLLFEGWSASTLLALFRHEDNMQSAVETVVDFLKKHALDGCVLEIWSQLGGHYKSEATNMVMMFSDMFHSDDLELILVIPSKLRGSMFEKQDFDNLVDYVDAFSLMTYDYSNPNRPGPVPVAPLDWVKDCVESLSPAKSDKRQKILLGLNFYGYDYGTSVQPVLGSSYIELLSKHKPKLQWDGQGKEHFIQYKTGSTQHILYYPSLLSVKLRVQLAEELGTGLSIWEIGQGLDYFYDLL